MVKPSLDLKAHYERVQIALASLHEAVVVTDAAGGVTFLNNAAQALTGWEPAAAQGKAVGAVVRLVANGATWPPRRGAVGMAWPTEQNLYLAGHYLWRANDSMVFPINGCATPMRDGAGNLIGTVWVFRDATADQQLASHLQAILHEQELRLREVHHRIKNNFQTIASLLAMQATALEDPRALAALEDCQQRIQSMALVHQSLYQSRELDRMDCAAYLRGLATELCRAHAAEERHITLTLRTDDVWVRVETAIPCGLILSELLANALKHAFPAGRPGNIEVTFRPDPIGLCVLNVRDDGVGFPAGLDFRQADSLGLQLVGLLAEQLGGTLEMPKGHGTHWKLTFPLVSSQSRGEDEAGVG
jgi:two-component system, sensor histidine kinase PdtaS